MIIICNYMIIADEFNFANGVRFTKTMNKVLTVEAMHRKA